jgi:uncharacterized membrane protein (UPF0182 family)
MASNKQQFDFEIPKGTRRFSIAVIVVIALAIIGYIAFQLVTDFIWMDTLSYGDVYTTILYSKVLLALSGFVLFFILTFLTIFFIRLSYMKHFSYVQLPPIVKKGKIAYTLIVVISFLVGLIGSSIIQGIGWEPALKLANYEHFNQVDPYFKLDVSFYMFVLPFIEFILYTLLNLFTFFLLVLVGAYSVFRMYRMSRYAQIHLASYLGIIGILLAGIHYLGKYNTLLTNQVNMFQKSVVHGLSYTDQLINIPKAYVLAVVAIGVAIWIMVALFRGNIQSSLTPIGIYIAFIIVGQVAAMVVQNFIVSPNEFTKEKPYLEHNLEFTRAAYDLDDIEIKESAGNASLDQQMIERNALTIDNVRLNDSRPLLDIYNQLQTFRTYYQFNNIDIDRYMVNGEYEQVFIGARELSTKDLPEQAQTWVNRNLRYTHGYGVAMSHVNKVTKQGQPQYMLKNIPVEGDIDITRPQIYFGEEKYPNVIVNSKVDEFDYPTGDENATNRYEADTGIPLTGKNKLLFALKESSFRLLFSDQLTKESQLLQIRNVSDRVKAIAPFFSYDNDPYIVIRDDGSLVWLIDAYVRASGYPYSESYDGDHNYIRNSVKVAVDAYTGEVEFYNAHPEDPIVQTYDNMFPDLFTKEIPEDIKAHFRYPVDLFKIQTAMYGTYHMSNLEVFYNREDFWQFPTEKYFNQDIEMDPYYITMELPENDQEEFILMLPYTPKKRQNMISWIGVRNDGEHYGEIFVYRFPKQKNIYGPQQIENRINQDSFISQQLNLWSQGGSEVIRGNLLVIPIEDTVLYVEPIYIESSNESSLPEVKQVVIAYEDHIVMEETFEKGLEKILGFVDSKQAPSKGNDNEKNEDNETDGKKTDEPDSDDAPILSAEEQLKEASKLFDDYQKAMADGDWAKAGMIMERLEKQLGEIK